MAVFIERDNSNIITERLYPVIANSLDKNTRKYKAMIADFMNKSHDGMYEIAPYDNIYYSPSDKQKLFISLGFTEQEIYDIMRDCFFFNKHWTTKGYNPQAAKEPYVMTLMCALRYFLKNKKPQETELTAIYLAFSGKFYASCFGAVFPKAPPSRYRAVMDYVINNMVNYKFDIKRTGNMFGAIKVLCTTWVETYKDEIIEGADDDRLGKILQQLKGRILSLLSNIGNLYYEAYADKRYLNYESDNLVDGEEFRITENDANTAARITNAAVTYMVSNSVNMKICNGFSNDRNVKPLELKDIIESIVTNKKNIPDLRRVINILICDFMRKNKGKHPSDLEFINYALKEQPNTNDQYIKEMLFIITNWLEENSDDYRRRKNRAATVISYRKSIKYYLAMIIQLVSRNEA